MSENVSCPHCSAWNAADLPWCRECGGALRPQSVPAAETPQTPASPGPPPADAVPPLAERERKLRVRKGARRKEWEELDRAEKRQERSLERASRRVERERELQDLASTLEEGATELQETSKAEGTPEEHGEERTSDTPSLPATDRLARPSREDGLPRIRTHIVGFDEALGGGIPEGFVVIVEGAPGTMKSSLAFWTLARNGIEGGRRGLYVTCEESGGSLLRQMRALGLDLDAAAPHVKILDAPLLGRVLSRPRADWLKALRATVESLRADRPFDLLVIDSLEALSVMAKFSDRRRELFRLFEWLRDLGLTTLVIAERPDYVVRGNVLQGRYDENFLADGVLNLRLHMISDLDVQRRVRIVKMRGTKHETGYMALQVGEGELEVSRVLRA